MKECIYTQDAPQPIGPYSQAVLINNTLFLSGQLAINPQSGRLEGDDVQTQARIIFKNIEAILKKAGFEISDVVKVNVYIANLSDFSKFNEVYAEIFKGNYPARTTIGCALIPGALVEVDLIAAK